MPIQNERFYASISKVICDFHLDTWDCRFSRPGGEYIGDYCWQDDDGSIMQAAVTHMGNGHYFLMER